MMTALFRRKSLSVLGEQTIYCSAHMQAGGVSRDVDERGLAELG